MIEALNGGIGIIVQENGTISEISVAENIFLGELKQFAGVNYFESRKIEDFSPLFDLDISTIEGIKKEVSVKVSSPSPIEMVILIISISVKNKSVTAFIGVTSIHNRAISSDFRLNDFMPLSIRIQSTISENRTLVILHVR